MLCFKILAEVRFEGLVVRTLHGANGNPSSGGSPCRPRTLEDGALVWGNLQTRANLGLFSPHIFGRLHNRILAIVVTDIFFYTLSR